MLIRKCIYTTAAIDSVCAHAAINIIIAGAALDVVIAEIAVEQVSVVVADQRIIARTADYALNSRKRIAFCKSAMAKASGEVYIDTSGVIEIANAAIAAADNRIIADCRDEERVTTLAAI